MNKKEKKDKAVSAAISFGLHGLLLILFMVLLASGGKEAPTDEIGFELEMGNAFEASGGSEQVVSEPVEEQQVEESQPEQEVVEERVEEVEETEVVEEVESTPMEADEPVEQEEVVEEVTPVEEVVEEEPKQEEKQEVINPNALYSKKGPGTGDDDAGDKDKGVKEGDVDDRALYSSSGGGGKGAQLSMAGWMWDSPPRPDDTSSETGRIVFSITIDANGEVIQITTKEKTVSNTVEKIYKEAVQNTTFSPLSSNMVPSQTTGEITFIIRSK